MFIAMNRFRVAKGSEAASNMFGCPATVISTRCRALSSFTFSKVRAEDHTLYASTPSGKTGLCSRRGPNLRRSGQRIVGRGQQVAVSRSSPVRGFEVRQTVGSVSERNRQC